MDLLVPRGCGGGCVDCEVLAGGNHLHWLFLKSRIFGTITIDMLLKLDRMKSLVKEIAPPRFRQFIKDAKQLAIFATPRAILPAEARLNARSTEWLKQLKDSGIVKIEIDEFSKVAGYLERKYFELIENQASVLKSKTAVYPWGENEGFVLDENKDTYKSGGTDIRCSISLADAGCRDLFLSRDLATTLYHYYGRQPYFRNQPLIQKIALREGDAISNGQFHVDHLRQVSVMLLVNDITENDTHMEYCVGSNQRNLLMEGIEMDGERCKTLYPKYPVFKCTGKKGTAFLFDTSGIHRANYQRNSTRKILHLNFTTGHNIFPFVDRKNQIAGLDGQPPFIRNMFRFLQ